MKIYFGSVHTGQKHWKEFIILKVNIFASYFSLASKVQAFDHVKFFKKVVSMK